MEGAMKHGILSTIAVAALLATSGCATTTWSKPGSLAGEFERDSYLCERDVAMFTPSRPVYISTNPQADAWRDLGYSIGESFGKAAMWKRCMRAAGWRVVEE